MKNSIKANRIVVLYTFSRHLYFTQYKGSLKVISIKSLARLKVRTRGDKSTHTRGNETCSFVTDLLTYKYC